VKTQFSRIFFFDVRPRALVVTHDINFGQMRLKRRRTCITQRCVTDFPDTALTSECCWSRSVRSGLGRRLPAKSTMGCATSRPTTTSHVAADILSLQHPGESRPLRKQTRATTFCCAAVSAMMLLDANSFFLLCDTQDCGAFDRPSQLQTHKDDLAG
jgi:hypothetical protein